MGEVYRADDLELGQSVALKFLPERVARNAADLARLRGEVRTARQIAHPNVCRTYDIAEAEAQVFVVMEYIDGEDLASVLRRLGRPSPDKALEIARQLCLGLGAAHENGVLHRDLKPANIMIDGRGRVRITDFGLAGTEEEIAAEGGIAGTPAYMAPEQQRSGATTAQSDIFSLGLVLYEVFTGKRASDMTPRPDPSRHGTDSSVRTPSSLVADIDPAVERVILRCLERDPARRPQSAYAVYGALPGGDPLAAAVAAGETPSPELVANAGVEGSVRPLWAGIAVAAAVLGFLGLSIVQRPLFTGLGRSSQVLSVRAEEILIEATGTAAPRFSSHGFRYAPAAKDSTPRGGSTPRADSLAAGRGKPALKPPRAKQYWRRWGPVPLVTTNIHSPFSTVDDPPQSFPGSGTVLVDTQGRLLGLSIIPDPSRDSMKTGVVDWAGLLRATGRDPSRIAATAPPAGFLAQADTIAAWTILGPAASDTSRAAAAESTRGTAAETTLVAAALRGRVIRFDTYAGTTALGNLTVHTREDSFTPQDWMWLLLLDVIPIIGSIFLARHNLRAGRGDVRGALVMGISIVVLYLLEYLFAINPGELGLYRVLGALTGEAPLGHALMHGVTMALFYLAIEPYVRRLWPGVLVSWARLVAGRVRDPIVGRDILVGGAWGIGLALLNVAGGRLARQLALTPEPVQASWWALRTTLGPQSVMATVSWDLAVALLRATTFFTVLVLLRFVLRSNRATAIGLVIVFTLLGVEFGQKTVWVSAAVGLVGVAATVILALRYGLVATVVMGLSTGLAEDLPWTSDLSAWFGPQTLFAWGIVGALLVYGFMTAVAGRSLFRDPLSDPLLGAPRAAK
jgi:serine/threonine-protein kinase